LESPDCAACCFEFSEMSISRGEKSIVTVSADLRGAPLGIATELEGVANDIAGLRSARAEMWFSADGTGIR